MSEASGSEYTTHSETLTNLEYVTAVELRAALLDNFAADPDNEDIWQTAYLMVAEEERPEWSGNKTLLAAHLGREQGIADDIPAAELINFAQTVRAADPKDRYSLTAQRASDGRLWFDVLETFSSPEMEAAKADVLRSFVLQYRDGRPFRNALDLGTGTGKSLAGLEDVSQSVVGLDRNGDLLREAAAVMGTNTSLVQADITAMPLTYSSYDLISSQGLVSSLDKKTAGTFFENIYFMLADDGVYIDVHTIADDREDNAPAAVAQNYSAKGMLADMIVDTVSGKFANTDHLSGVELGEFLRKYDLEMQYQLYEDPKTGKQLAMRYIHFPNAFYYMQHPEPAVEVQQYGPYYDSGSADAE